MGRPRKNPLEDSSNETPATEREPAPETVTPVVDVVDAEKEELKARLEEAEKDKEAALALLDKATQPAPIPQVVLPPIQAPVAQLPRNMRVERAGTVSAQYSTRWPQIRGGTCEFCGVLDPYTPAQYQYKLCSHFRGMTARCTYCPENKDPDEIVYHSNMNVATHPDNPGTIIMWCNSYACSDAHIKRFSRSTV